MIKRATLWTICMLQMCVQSYLKALLLCFMCACGCRRESGPRQAAEMMKRACNKPGYVFLAGTCLPERVMLLELRCAYSSA